MLVSELSSASDGGVRSSIFYFEGRQMLAAPRGDPMQVSEKHLEFMMTKVFTFPRNTQFDKVSRVD